MVSWTSVLLVAGVASAGAHPASTPACDGAVDSSMETCSSHVANDTDDCEARLAQLNLYIEEQRSLLKKLKEEELILRRQWDEIVELRNEKRRLLEELKEVGVGGAEQDLQQLFDSRTIPKQGVSAFVPQAPLPEQELLKSQVTVDDQPVRGLEKNNSQSEMHPLANLGEGGKLPIGFDDILVSPKRLNSGYIVSF